VSDSSEGFRKRRPPHSQADASQDDTWPSTRVPDEVQAGRQPARSSRPSPQPGHTAQASDQDEIETPSPFTPPPMGNSLPPPTRGASSLLRFLVGLALILSLASLALNAYLIYTFMSVRQTAVEMLDSAILGLEDVVEEGLYYEYQFEQSFPFAAEVPIQQEIIFPFEGNFPINTTVRVPIDAGVLGTFMLDVPIDTSVYVETKVPVRIDETFEVSTTIPVSMTIPIELDPDDPAIQGFLDRVRQWLLDLRGFLGPGAPQPATRNP
jgi:hypothetical protein